MLLVEAIAALAALGLEGFYLVTGLLHRAGHKSTDWPTGCAEAEKPATGKYRGRARKEGAFDATC